jgi:hypothetical protein
VARSVAFETVVSEVRRFGPLATLVTVTAASAPHVCTVQLATDTGQLSAKVGSRTRENIKKNPAVTLTWTPEQGDYQLILDGTATVDDHPGPDGLHDVQIDVDQGILHRIAGRLDSGPSCVAVGSAPTAAR